MNLKPSIYLQDMSLEKIILTNYHLKTLLQKIIFTVDEDVDKRGHATSQECMVR